MWNVTDSKNDGDFLCARGQLVRTVMKFDWARLKSFHVK